MTRPARQALVPVLLALLAGGLYAQTLQAGFVYDDHLAIVANPAVQDPTVGSVLGSSFWGPAEADRIATWRPLVTATFALDAWLGRVGAGLAGRPGAGLDPMPFHATNVVLWVLLVLAVWRLGGMLALSPRARLVSCLLLVVHPLATEPVASLVGRADLLVALTGLGYVGAMIAGRPWIAMAWLAAALASKETAVVLPAVAAAWWLARLWRDRLVAAGVLPSRLPNPARAWKEGLALLHQVPLFARRVANALAAGRVREPLVDLPWRRVLLLHGLVLGLWLAGRVLVLGDLSGPPASVIENPVLGAGPWERLIGALNVAGLAGRLLLLDGSLSSDYGLGHFPPLVSGPASAFGWVVLGLLALGLWHSARRSPRVTLALALVAAPMALFSHLLVPLPTAFAERLWVLPLCGVSMLIGIGVDRALSIPFRLRPALYALLALLLLLAGATSALRLPDWRDDQAVFEAMVRTAPGSYRANVNAAAMALERGEVELARTRLQRAIDVFDASPIAWLALARLETAAGQEAPARQALEAAQARGGLTDAWLSARCGAAARFSSPAEADAQCRAAVDAARRGARQTDPELLLQWAIALDRGGRVAEAAPLVDEAVQLARTRGTPPQVALNAGIFHARQGNDAQALELLLHAFGRQPQRDAVRQPLAAVCARIAGRGDASPRELLERATACLQKLGL